jgi:hypothetical protein
MPIHPPMKLQTKVKVKLETVNKPYIVPSGLDSALTKVRPDGLCVLSVLARQRRV